MAAQILGCINRRFRVGPEGLLPGATTMAAASLLDLTLQLALSTLVLKVHRGISRPAVP